MEPSAPVKFALGSIERGDLTEAIRGLEAEEEASQVGANYGQLIKILYGQRRDVTNMAAMGNAAVRYLLTRSKLAAERDEAAAAKLKTAARKLSYNVAANCWPGWGDEGVAIEPSHIEDGLKLAILSLRLVEELKPGVSQLGSAHWLVGALQLVAGKIDACLLSFGQAREAFASIGDKAATLLTEGYFAIAIGRAPHLLDDRAKKLDEVIGQLVADGSKQANAFANQLRTAAPILDERWQHSRSS
jgi:hypothetical protein